MSTYKHTDVADDDVMAEHSYTITVFKQYNLTSDAIISYKMEYHLGEKWPSLWKSV